MVFHNKLGDTKSAQVSGALFSSLADIINAVVWMTSICPPILNSSILLFKPMGNIPPSPFLG